MLKVEGLGSRIMSARSPVWVFGFRACEPAKCLCWIQAYTVLLSKKP